MDRNSHPPSAGDGFDQVKASVLRGYSIAMAEMGMLPDVRDRLPAATLAMVTDPPPSTAWIPGIVVQHVNDAIVAVRDYATVRACGLRSTEVGTGVIARNVIETALRLFGASPAALFSRYSTLSANFIKGIEFHYEAESETAGVMMMRIPSRPVSRASFCATAGSFEFVLGLCQKRGTVEEPELLPNLTGGAAQYRINWRR